MSEIHIFLIVILTILFSFASTIPDDPFIKPWMRALSLVIGLTACLWFPWVALAVSKNYEACFGVKPELTEVEK